MVTTTSTANVGVSSSVSYLDVGLKLDVEPSVSLEDDVSIKVGLEVSSISKEISGPSGSLAYQIGTRTAGTALRLHDGETQMLAGLINDEERSSANRLPGLGEIPLLGRLFSSERDSGSKTEIVLLVTPRIVRNLERPEVVEPALPAGTDAEVGAAPLKLAPRLPNSLSLKSSGPVGARPPAPEAEVAPAAEAPPAPEIAPASEVPSAPPAASTGTVAKPDPE